MISFLLVAFASTPAPVVVSSLETTQLLRHCEEAGTRLATNFCTGYIMGEFDTLSISRQICPSATGASTPEAVAATRAYLNTHPEKWSNAPAFVVRDALRAAFPCKQPKKSNARPAKAAPARKKRD